MEVLPSSRDVAVRNLTAIAIAGHQYNYHATAKRDLHSLLDPVLDASHTRNRKTSPPDSICLPGTRQNLIQKVTSWAGTNVVFDGNHVYWLYGYVGCGKSAIAQTIAEGFQDRQRLAASFFFFRNSGARGKISKLAATIACQMAVAIPSTAPLIEAAVKADPSLLTSCVTVRTQFQRLVYEPFMIVVGWGFELAILLKGPFLIIIDGLDECNDLDEVAEFIDHMLGFFKKNPLVPLRYLITSRVEEHIRTRLQGDKVTVDNLVDYCTDDDIAAVVRAAFVHAAKHNRVVQAYGNWPAQNEVNSLVKCSRGSFIFISLLLKYILGPSNDGLTPMERLPLALDINSTLDGLYMETLSRSKDLPHFTDVVSTIALVKEPLSIASIAAMLEIKIFEVVRVLVNLHAILQVPGDDVTPVTMCHSSLHEFLTTESRSGPFHARPSVHERLAHRCLDLPIQFPDSDPVAQYAVKHGISHFRIACGIQLDNDEDVRRLYCNINDALRVRFPNSVTVVMSAYFLWRRTYRLHRSWIPMLATALEPKVPTGETISIVGTLEALKAIDPLYPRTIAMERPLWTLRLGESNMPHCSHYMDLPLQCISFLLGSPPPQAKSQGNTTNLFQHIFINWPLYFRHAFDHNPGGAVHLEHICESARAVERRLEEIDAIHLSPDDLSNWQYTISGTVSFVKKQSLNTVAANSMRPSTAMDWIQGNAGSLIESREPLSVVTLLEGFQQLSIRQFLAYRIRLGGGVGIMFLRIGVSVLRISYTYEE